MSVLQAVATLSNTEALCVGEITQIEADNAMQDDPSFTGSGIYLMAVSKMDPMSPAKVLAKFASEDAALVLAQFFRMVGQLEAA